MNNRSKPAVDKKYHILDFLSFMPILLFALLPIFKGKETLTITIGIVTIVLIIATIVLGLYWRKTENLDFINARNNNLSGNIMDTIAFFTGGIVAAFCSEPLNSMIWFLLGTLLLIVTIAGYRRHSAK